MATKIVMPTLGLTMTEGTIEEWKFKEGEQVNEGDVLFSMSTDKLTNDIEAEVSGTLLKIIVGEGETAKCKATIAWIGEAGEAVPDADGESSEDTPTEKSAAEEAPAEETEAPKAASVEAGGWVRATPYARRLAKEKGYDLAAIGATGPDGVIVAKDVESYTAGPKVSPLAAKIAAEVGVDTAKMSDALGRVMTKDVLYAAGLGTEVPAPAASDPYKEAAEDNDCEPVKVDPLRRSIAKNMAESWTTSPSVTFTHPVDCTALIKMRESLKPSFAEAGLKITYNHIIMKVCARALMEFPDVNASFKDNMLTRHKHANIGLAVAKGDGLIVPNVKACESKSLTEIAEETEALIAKTREGKIEMPDITGGTFSVSSLGPFGVTNFSPIINQPELAILGVCDIVDTPVVRDGEVVIRPMMNLCLTADHRVVDGVKASKFLKRIVELLENPCLLLA